LVRTASSDYADDATDMTLLDSYSDSDSELPHLPLLGFQQQQQRQQPSVADDGHASDFADGSVTDRIQMNGADAEWGLGVGDSNPDSTSVSATVSAMQRFRRQMTITLGGAHPPVEQQLAAAAGTSSSRSSRKVKSMGKHSSSSRQQQQGTAAAAAVGDRGQLHSQPGVPRASWRGAGISVLGSLVAVTGDLRVVLLAAVLSAAAGSLSTLNPNSIWHSSSSSFGPPPTPAATTTAWGDGVYRLLQQLLWVVGLSQRGDSPSVVGAVVLMGLALLVLLVAVGVSLALKWCLDYVTAFNR
jgi:hypothetical protein